ncbi:hypothetical protein SSP35_01_03260 [Streptomyces sp. NBRC 110611]|uniref:hypothetical protein n=1 Tax=Streptomyces sp. NBRC 110611 TaxID=1621259 RepID=UPI000833BAFF|nr:hypothetical protein [Streptomyces sp. NBRC 110611]GAU64989.1 hypothetical protein SSP35_01_03260 [Streptomyces sp. NBRC 110611]
MKRKLALTTATAVIGVGGLVGVAPAATAAPSSPATTTAAAAAASSAQQSGTETFITDAQGRKVAKIKYTTLNTRAAKGWVKKLSNDKICAQALVKWYKGGKVKDTDLSKKVCRKGKTHHFSLRAGDKPHFFTASKVKAGIRLS